MNQYLIPANAKKGELLFNIFRWVDLGVLASGILLTLILVFVVGGQGILAMLIKLLPLGISILLVMPVAYYHNVLVFLQEVYTFYTKQRAYSWKGWCATIGNDKEQN